MLATDMAATAALFQRRAQQLDRVRSVLRL